MTIPHHRIYTLGAMMSKLCGNDEARFLITQTRISPEATGF
jgi:hypothetical protein